MKKKNIESNVQSLTSEKDELLFLINDLRSKWIENNKRKYKKISRRLTDLNNTVDNEIRIVSLHDKQRKNLEDLQNELLAMNWLLNQYQNPNYYQNVQFNNQLQQNYNQARIDDNRLNEEETQVIEVSNNGNSWKSWWNWNTLRTLWWAAAGVWLWVLLYKWFKKLFWKDEEVEEKDEKDIEEKNNKWQESMGNDNREWEDNREEPEKVEKYDEWLVRRYKDMVQYLESHWTIRHTEKSHRTIRRSCIEANYGINTSDKFTSIHLSKIWTIDDDFEDSILSFDQHMFTYYENNGTGYNINNKKLKEVLDSYDNYIRKYG